MCGIRSRRTGNAIDRNDGIGLIQAATPDRIARWMNGAAMGTMGRKIAGGAVANVPTPAASDPPGIAVARCPAPAEIVIVIPVSAGIGQVAPLFAGDPDVAVLCRGDPVAAAVGIPVSRSCFGGRPHITL